MARLAFFAAFLLHLQPAFASFYTVTSYFVLTETSSKLYSTCVEDCRYYTATRTLTVDPTITPTADPISTTTRTYTYDDLEIVSVFVGPDAVDAGDVFTSSTRVANVFTDYAVTVVWTAPSSCPTPFTVTTHSPVYLPYDIRPYVTAVSTATSVWTNTRETETVTWVTKFIDASILPPSSRPTGAPTTNYYYSYFVENCRNPTATGPAYYGPTATARGGGSGGGGSRGGADDDWDWNVCSAYTGCVVLATWVIVIAVLFPTIFLIGFIESYCWFRRMMLGRSALRLGTICWCVMSLWFILLTRKSRARSPEDQALLKQYWDTLSAGTRIKYWFKYGFRWRYPVELLGNPDGNNPVIVAAPPPGQFPPGQPGDGSEKPQATAQQQPIYMMQPGQQPYPGQPYMQPVPGQPYMQPAPGQPYMQPYPGQPYPVQPGFNFPFPQGQAPMQGQQPGFAPAPQMGDGQRQPQQQAMQQPYMPAPSPAQTGTTEVPSGQPTPPPGHGPSQTQPPVQQQQQPPSHP
ncbi:predicted protein [Chaetomium globosum CBS 148.51]|uniref:Uncharacterized protein n=1 Tax=Chaetomium globosum (strain ATCC 6205 / CBS 148.51 / DSM 1962 / NBRC 6347 / NRRL 1970) TaxID=306901 RepID=Q2HHF9_CHAGB|nr:uncharacterized protein CHGG_00345 [Chaetomium globosum CBS 148.51]EAQ92110.1 predicted protein [Chaetomium globosum CBS 148.51]